VEEEEEEEDEEEEEEEAEGLYAEQHDDGDAKSAFLISVILAAQAAPSTRPMLPRQVLALLLAAICLSACRASASSVPPSITMFDRHHHHHQPLVDGRILSCNSDQKSHVLVSLSPPPPSTRSWRLSVHVNQSGVT
jgi:hypothetical protein